MFGGGVGGGGWYSLNRVYLEADSRIYQRKTTPKNLRLNTLEGRGFGAFGVWELGALGFRFRGLRGVGFGVWV